MTRDEQQKLTPRDHPKILAADGYTPPESREPTPEFLADAKAKNEAYAKYRHDLNQREGLASAGSAGVRTFKVGK